MACLATPRKRHKAEICTEVLREGSWGCVQIQHTSFKYSLILSVIGTFSNMKRPEGRRACQIKYYAFSIAESMKVHMCSLNCSYVLLDVFHI